MVNIIFFTGIMKPTKNILLSIAYFCVNILSAQTFQKSFTGSGSDRAHGVINTSDGGFAITGYSNSYGQGGNDLFLIKTDGLGNILWQKTYGSSGQENGLSIAITETPDQGFVMVGATTGFGSSSMDVYVVRVDQVGTVQWSGKYNTPSDNEHARGVLIAANGDILVVGSDNQNGFGGSDGLVLRLSSSGNYLWSRIFGGNLNEHFHSVHELPGGNLIVTGSSSSYGPGATSGYVLKLTNDGNIIWDYTYGAAGNNAFNSSELTSDYNVVCTGFSDSYGGGNQVITTKIDTNGTLLWTTIYGGNNFERGAAIREIPNSTDYYIASNTESFGSGGKEILISRMGSNGNLLWNKTVGTTQNDELDQWANNTLVGLTDGGFAFVGWSNGIGAGGENILFVRSDFQGQNLCNIASPSVTSPILTRINPSTGMSITGTYNNVSSFSSNSSFTSGSPCFCNLTPQFDPIPDLCQNSDAPVLNNTSNNGITGTWSPSSINTDISGTFNFTFTPNSNQCASAVSMSINIFTPTIIPSFNQIGPFCQYDLTQPLPNTDLSGITGTWVPAVISTNTSGTNTYSFSPDDNQCAQSISVSILINELITPEFNPFGPYCLNEVAPPLPNTDLNGVEGTWNPTSINTTSQGSSTYTFIPNSNLCTNDLDVIITVNQANINPIFDQIDPLCIGDESIILPDVSNNGISGTWDPLNVNTGTEGTFDYTFIPNDGQCAQNTSMSIVVLHTPSVYFTADTLVGCEELFVAFSGQSDTGVNYEWFFGDGSLSVSGQSVTHNYLIEGCFDVSLLISDLNGCTNELVVADYICLLPQPESSFQPNQVYSCFPTTFEFNNTSLYADSFVWVLNSSDTIYSLDNTYLEIDIAESTTIELIALNELGCSDNFVSEIFIYNCGCMDSLALNFNGNANFDDGSCVYPTPWIHVPNVFTPNDDQANDFYFINTKFVSHVELTILNRWGNVMFNENGTNPQWDGKFNGDESPEGTYFCIYKVHGLDDSVLSGHGFLYLER